MRLGRGSALKLSYMCMTSGVFMLKAFLGVCVFMSRKTGTPFIFMGTRSSYTV